MRFALLNPNWNFNGSTYFGCTAPHLPLEFGYARESLTAAGHEVLLIDAHLDDLPLSEIRQAVKGFAPDFIIITTAPTYLFWRCAPPELRVPLETLAALSDIRCVRVAVGPHASTTPKATLRKLGVDLVVLGECEEVLPKLTGSWSGIASIAYRAGDNFWIQGTTHASNMNDLPALRWPASVIEKHGHHHHRFDAEPNGPGAEVEASRGCPYHCTFCAKDNFRDKYRRRPVATVLDEIDGLLTAGVEYLYFIDEIFLPNKELLEALVHRKTKFGMQTRIDLWTKPMIDLLGQSGCVSVEAGVESLTEHGRNSLAKQCRLSTDELTDRLVYAKAHIPFVQANLILTEDDNPAEVEAWRENIKNRGVWANAPVPLFPYPGSPEYTARWGVPDDVAWERAHSYYLEQYTAFSDVQQDHPLTLPELESVHECR